MLISITTLFIIMPILLLIALFIAIDSNGGIIYTQLRIGKNGKQFRILKFRTMKVNSDKLGLLTIGGKDPRITKVGYYLRKLKLDELPQLLNVIKGDMSLVGPRPEVLKYVSFYTKEQLLVLNVRPGITDYASIEYANENAILAKYNNPEEAYITEIMPSKLQLNLKYINDLSLITDVRIIFMTLKKIIG